MAPKITIQTFDEKLVLREDLKARFPEVAVKCERVRDQKIFHQSKTCAVCETPRFMLRPFEHIERFFEQALFYPEYANTLAFLDLINKNGG